MVKKITAVCVALTLYACASSGVAGSGPKPAEITGTHLIALPKPGALVIIGAAGRQLKQETEIDTAREDAARKAALYHGFQISFESVQSIGPDFFDYFTGSEIILEYDTELEKYMDRLAFDPDRDVITGNGGVFVRFTYPVSFPGNLNYQFERNLNGSPEWTSHPPREINGFMAGVGFSGRQFRFKDTFEKSCDAAAAALVSRLSTVVTIRETSAGDWNSSVIHQRSKGRLDHFLVLEIWVDPDTQAVWTLAVARNAE